MPPVSVSLYHCYLCDCRDHLETQLPQLIRVVAVEMHTENVAAPLGRDVVHQPPVPAVGLGFVAGGIVIDAFDFTRKELLFDLFGQPGGVAAEVERAKDERVS